MYVYGNVQGVISCGETEAELRIDSVVKRIKLLLVEDYIQNYSIIVGHSFIDRENISLLKTKGHLTFTYGVNFPFENDKLPEHVDNVICRVTVVNNEETVSSKNVKIVCMNAKSDQLDVLIINNDHEDIH